MLWGGGMLCISEEYHVVKCEVINGFAYAVRGEVGREGVCSLKTIGNSVANPTCEEGFPVMVQRYWSASK